MRAASKREEARRTPRFNGKPNMVCTTSQWGRFRAGKFKGIVRVQLKLPLRCSDGDTELETRVNAGERLSW